MTMLVLELDEILQLLKTHRLWAVVEVDESQSADMYVEDWQRKLWPVRRLKTTIRRNGFSIQTVVSQDGKRVRSLFGMRLFYRVINQKSTFSDNLDDAADFIVR